MDNEKILSILVVSNTRYEGDLVAESCGEFCDELTGYSVIIRQDKKDDFIDYAVDTFGATYKMMMVDALDTDSAEDIADTCAMCRVDDMSFTELFIKSYGGYDKVLEEMARRGEGSEEVEQKEDDAVIVDVDPVNADSEVPDDVMDVIESLKNREEELIETKKQLDEIKESNRVLVQSLEERIKSLEESVGKYKSKFDVEKVPDFAVSYLVDVISKTQEQTAVDALTLILQDLSSTEDDNFILYKLIQLLASKYSELGAICFE